MVETSLYNALSDYNKLIQNNYSQNWGSLLNFMDGDDTKILTEKADNMMLATKQIKSNVKHVSYNSLHHPK